MSSSCSPTKRAPSKASDVMASAPCASENLPESWPVSMLHTLFEMLAFKSDVKFWRHAKSMAGLSLRSLLSPPRAAAARHEGRRAEGAEGRRAVAELSASHALLAAEQKQVAALREDVTRLHAALQHQVQQLAARVGIAAGSAAPTEAPPLIVDKAAPDAEFVDFSIEFMLELDARESSEAFEPEAGFDATTPPCPSDSVRRRHRARPRARLGIRRSAGRRSRRPCRTSRSCSR